MLRRHHHLPRFSELGLLAIDGIECPQLFRRVLEKIALGLGPRHQIAMGFEQRFSLAGLGPQRRHLQRSTLMPAEGIQQTAVGGDFD